MGEQQDCLIVVSKSKKYLKEKYGCNTSAEVEPFLSNLIRKIFDEAAENARADGRKTVMHRDLEQMKLL